MALARFIQNISGSASRINGVSIANNAFLEVELFGYAELASSEEIFNGITNDEILLSFDGVTSLSKANSLLLLKTFGEAEQTYFDHDETQFNQSIKDVRAALLDLRTDLDSGTSGLFEATKTTAQNITDVLTPIIFNNQKLNTDTALFSLNTATGVVTFNRATNVFVLGKITIDTSDNSRIGSRGFVQFSNGGAFANIDGSRGSSYHRNLDVDEGTIVVTTTISVQVGDQIRLAALLYDGDNNSPLGLDGCNLIIKESEARGPRGLRGEAAFQYRFGNGAPSNLLGDDGDIYQDNLNGDVYRKDSGAWVLETNVTGPSGTTKYYIWAEENGGLSNNNTQWSFGNGSVGNIGVVAIEAGEITGMSLSGESAGNATTTVEILINGASSGLSITLAPNVADDFTTFVTPLAFNAGDRIGFRTVLGGSMSDARVAALIRSV